MKISVVINTYNSEIYLRRVLESVKGFDEIVICDMHSTDKTISIAEEYSCKIVYHERYAYVEPARQFAIQSASYEWILVVDSDEIVPEILRHYLYEKIGKKNPPEALWIPRKNYFMGHFLHGDYPDYILRFFKKEGAFWSSHIHVPVKIEGKEESIPAKRKDLAFIHLANNSVHSKLHKINTYSDYEVGKRKDQNFPYFKILYAPTFRFIKSYFIKRGIWDGKAGLINAAMDAFYKFVTIAKIWESRISPDDIDPELRN
jgi:Glycosyltransferases involved in cell wall biogenesis